MKITISGAGGLIGQHIVSYFKKKGYEIEHLFRNDFQSIDILKQKISGSDVVINLAGESINQKWNKKTKATILRSRVETTSAIVEAISKSEIVPKRLISASAIGIYAEDQIHSESSENLGKDFLAEVCIKWEKAALTANPYCDVSIIRLGIVLSGKGGALKKMLPLFRFWLGGKIGDGRQYMSWIHINDVVGAIENIIKQGKSSIYNLSSPGCTTNKEFTRILASVLNRWALFPLPSWLIKVLFGERASVILSGQKVIPQRLLEEGYKFQFSTLDLAIRDAINNL